MDSEQSKENRDMMSASPAEPTPGRTPNGTLPPLRRRRQNADPLVRPKDRNRKPPQNTRPQGTGQVAHPNGIALGRTQAMPHHPARPPTAPQRRSTPDANREPEPVSGFSSAPIGPVLDIPLVTTKASLIAGLRHHVARFASRKPVDPRNTEEFTRPVRLHRRDPRIPVPGKDDLTGDGAENGAIDEKDKEMQEALKAEKKRQRELNLAQIAPTANAGGQRKNHYGKKTQQVYRNDQTAQQKAKSQLRYEEAMPWHLEDFDNKSTWVGTYEAALSDTYVALALGADGKFRMVPVEKWYKFTSKQQFKILSIDDAEKAMNKKVTQPRWFMDTQKAGGGPEGEAAAASKGLYLGRFEAQRGQATARSRAPKAEPDADDLDFEEDRFADDEENPYLEGPEEDNKEIEEKVKRDQLRANFFDTKDEKEADEEEEALKKEKELEKAFGKSYKKALMKKEKNYIYDTDSDNPYSEKSESESSETERRKEEERKKEEQQKGNTSDQDKAKAGKGSKNPSGANTPSGRPSKHPNPLKKTASSNNLKRPGSPNASDASGNESARKKRKQRHLTPATAAGSTSLKPPSRPMSPDYAPPSSSAQRPNQSVASEQATNKRSRADAGSGSEMSGGEMSDGKRKKQKLKLRMSASPDQSPNGSRAVSPEVRGEKSNGAAAGTAAKAASPLAPTIVPPLDITTEEARRLIPPDGISISKLVKHFAGRISKEQMGQFKRLMSSVSRYDKGTSKFHPLPETSGQ